MSSLGRWCNQLYLVESINTEGYSFFVKWGKWKLFFIDDIYKSEITLYVVTDSNVLFLHL